MKDCPICQTAPIHTFDGVEAWKAHAKEAHPAIYQFLVAGTPTRPTLPTRPPSTATRSSASTYVLPPKNDPQLGS